MRVYFVPNPLISCTPQDVHAVLPRPASHECQVLLAAFPPRNLARTRCLCCAHNFNLLHNLPARGKPWPAHRGLRAARNLSRGVACRPRAAPERPCLTTERMRPGTSMIRAHGAVAQDGRAGDSRHRFEIGLEALDDDLLLLREEGPSTRNPGLALPVRFDPRPAGRPRALPAVGARRRIDRKA